uniref:Uncharacterized protein n=1 Tax=Octopus bimaculoides TaxID=37653 RepID=A0A0L8G211_OCTBM
MRLVLLDLSFVIRGNTSLKRELSFGPQTRELVFIYFWKSQVAKVRRFNCEFHYVLSACIFMSNVDSNHHVSS